MYVQYISCREGVCEKLNLVNLIPFSAFPIFQSSNIPPYLTQFSLMHGFPRLALFFFGRVGEYVGGGLGGRGQVARKRKGQSLIILITKAVP